MIFPHVSFESLRLRLRPLSPLDADAIFPYITKEITRFWIGWECPTSREECMSWVEKIIAQDGIYFIALDKENETFIGIISIDIIPKTGEYEIGIWVREDRHSQWYATEMLTGFIGWLKQNTNLPYVIYSYTQGNTWSRHLLNKVPHAFARKEWEHKNGKRVYTQNFMIPLKSSNLTVVT